MIVLRALATFCVSTLACGCYSTQSYTGSADAGTDDVHVADTAVHDSTDTTLDLPADTVADPGFPVDCSTVYPVEGLTASRRMDMLVVVDNSRSMAEEQAMLVDAFPLLLTELLAPAVEPYSGEYEHPPIDDLHLGVVSTDMGTGGYMVETCADPIDGDDGILRHTPNPSMPSCDSAYPTYWSYDHPEEPDLPAVEEIGRAFGCIATLGTSGCGFEQQLEAARRAFEHATPSGPNAGFLREDSILVVVFLTDEEDCSVSDGHIFDTSDTSLGHLSLRCYLHPYMVHPVERYIDLFRAMRSDPEMLHIGVIAGVPADPACEGAGDAIWGCLDHPAMMEQIDPMEPTRLVPSCNTWAGMAFPPRRLVSLAQAFGSNAIVGSLCRPDISATVQGFADQLADSISWSSFPDSVEADHPVSDPCRCELGCTLIEALVDMRPCPAEKPCYEPDGPGTGCVSGVDDVGNSHRLCEIPEAGTRIVGCSPYDPVPIPDCDDPFANHAPDTTGFFFITPPAPLAGLHFTAGMEPMEDSMLWLVCCD